MKKWKVITWVIIAFTIGSSAIIVYGELDNKSQLKQFFYRISQNKSADLNSKDILAYVNNKPIYVGEFDLYICIRKSNSEIGYMDKFSEKKDDKSIREDIFNILAKRILLIQESNDVGIFISEEEVLKLMQTGKNYQKKIDDTDVALFFNSINTTKEEFDEIILKGIYRQIAYSEKFSKYVSDHINDYSDYATGNFTVDDYLNDKLRSAEIQYINGTLN